MNAYVVSIPELRDYMEPILDDGTGPVEWYQPLGFFVAETPAQAKRDALRDWTQQLYSGVYYDDWPRLRVRLVEKDVSLPRGNADQVDRFWNSDAVLAVSLPPEETTE